jgi:hypothetical protein
MAVPDIDVKVGIFPGKVIIVVNGKIWSGPTFDSDDPLNLAHPMIN